MARVTAMRLAIDFELDEDPAEVLLAELRYSRAMALFWEDQIARHGPDGSGRVAKIGTHDDKGVPHLTVEAELWQRERDRAISVAQACVKLGLEQRRVELAEAAGREFAQVIRGIVRRLGVADHPELGTVLAEELGRLKVLDAPALEAA